MNAEFERVLQDVLDGVATPEQKQRLDEECARDPQARARREEMTETFRVLARVRMVEAPADLEPRIMAAIAAQDRAVAPAHGAPDHARRRSGGRAAPRAHSAPAWAFAFGAGVVAGGLLIAFVTQVAAPRWTRDLPVAGAMMPRPAGAPIDRQEIVCGAQRVTLAARRRTGGLEVGFAAASTRAVELRLEFDAERLRPAGLRWDRAGAHDAALATGSLSMRLTPGERGTLLLIPGDEGDAPIHVTMHSEAAAAQGTLHTATAGRRR
jgi:hypothetical protein